MRMAVLMSVEALNKYSASAKYLLNVLTAFPQLGWLDSE